MARKKLYGAAASARKKRLAKLKRKRKPAKKNPARKSTSTAKRKAAARKGAATRKRKAAARSLAAKKAARTRKRRTGAKKNPARKRAVARRKPVKRRRKRALKRNPAPKRRKLTAAARKRRKSYGGKRSSRGLSTVSRARRSIKASKRRGGLSGAYVRKYKMKTNPGGIMQAVKTALPIAGAFYVSKVVSNKLGDLPAVSGVMSKLQVGSYNLGKPVLSGLLLAGTHYGTRKGALAKHRTGLMLGTALAFLDSIVSTFAPADVKSMMGVGDYGYGSMGEYVSTGEYVASGEYVAQGDYEQGVAPDVHGLHAVDGLHEIHAIHGIDAELGAIEAGADVGMSNGIFANSW